MSLGEALRKPIKIPNPFEKLTNRGPYWGPFYFTTTGWRKDLLYVLRQVSAIADANAPLVQGLDASAVDAPNGNVETMMMLLRDDLAAGHSLGEAMERRPRFYPPFYARLVQAGESTGTIGKCMDTVVEDVLSEINARQTFKQDLALVSFTLFVQFTIFMIFMVTVMPKFSGILGEFSVAPSSFMEFGATVADWVLTFPWTFLTCVLTALTAVFVVYYRLRRFPLPRRPIATPLFSLPFIGSFCRKSNLSDVLYVTSRLLEAGVPLDTALEEASDNQLHPMYKRALTKLAGEVRAGKTLSETMDAHAFALPKSFRTLVSLGERSGNLPQVMENMGEMYRSDALLFRSVLGNFVLPITVLIVGVVVLYTNSTVFMVFVQIQEAISADI